MLCATARFCVCLLTAAVTTPTSSITVNVKLAAACSREIWRCWQRLLPVLHKDIEKHKGHEARCNHVAKDPILSLREDLHAECASCQYVHAQTQTMPNAQTTC